MVHKKEANKKKIIVSETNLVLQFSPASNSGGSTRTNQGNLFFHLQTSGDLYGSSLNISGVQVTEWFKN